MIREDCAPAVADAHLAAFYEPGRGRPDYAALETRSLLVLTCVIGFQCGRWT
jgi:hypothetical protein